MTDETVRLTIGGKDNYVALRCFDRIVKTEEGLSFKLDYSKRNLTLLHDLKAAKNIDIRGMRYYLKPKQIKLDYKENGYNVDRIIIPFIVHRKENISML